MSATPPQQYCLRWNNYQNNLTNVFDQLLQSEAFVDVTLACDGHSLKAHKMVLSACSPYFQSLFFDNPCSHPIVILKDIKWEELKAVVEFMYRGEINVSQEQLAPLLKVAEVLKIRGLADVSRGGGGHNSSGMPPSSGVTGSATKISSNASASNGGGGGAGIGSGSGGASGINPADFVSNSNHDSDSESPSHTNGHHHHLGHTIAHAHVLATLRRKRRKMSTPDRTPSPPDTLDEHSNQLEIDSNNGDYDHSPSLSAIAEVSGGASLSINPTPANTPSMTASGSTGQSLPSGSLGNITPALLNLHNAAAVAAAAAVSSASNPNVPSSSVANDLDLKPGIVEMIREEERAKMLESSHGWLGPSASTLSDSYQYQIQSLWQKCWNTNQTGMVHALRFRERGPLKSWRPETMAEAIFAVLREGLSLSQAARKYDIPYPTFVLYANRVHNMLGPSADGCSGSDLISDMRPKGRGRPQRILLGSWPEEHIRGVIRAVVFRDTQGKDEMPFVFNRDTSLALQQQQQSSSSSSSHNGLDMSLHPQFGGNACFLAAAAAAAATAQQSSVSNPGSSSMGSSPNPNSNTSTPTATGNSANTNNNPLASLNSSNSHSTGNNPGGDSSHLPPSHHVQVQMAQHGPGTPGGGRDSSSTSSSPLQQVLQSGIGAQAQSQLLALQQRHHQQLLQQQHQLQQHLQQQQAQQQQHHRSSASSGASSPLGLVNKRRSTSIDDRVALSVTPRDSYDDNNALASLAKGTEAEILQIKAELPPFHEDDDEDDVDDMEEDGHDAMHSEEEDDQVANHSGVSPLHHHQQQLQQQVSSGNASHHATTTTTTIMATSPSDRQTLAALARGDREVNTPSPHNFQASS